MEITNGSQKCCFEYDTNDAPAISRLLNDLRIGGLTVAELIARAPEIAEAIPPLLDDFNRLRLVTESALGAPHPVYSGSQIYRELRRLADRTMSRVAKASFQRALTQDRATREQLIGYALEYHFVVKSAPGLIAPALAMSHCPAAQALLQNFLQSELGHDRLLASALAAVGMGPADLELHLPLPSTFAVCASLGVYARQHPLSFAASLFLFERAQPEFVAAFDDRCRDLGLPEAFYEPLRAHAEINDEFAHEDISRALLQLESVVDAESYRVVQRNVSIMVETLVNQEEEILFYYGQERGSVPRLIA